MNPKSLGATGLSRWDDAGLISGGNTSTQSRLYFGSLSSRGLLGRDAV